jgi:hypothetical protein
MRIPLYSYIFQQSPFYLRLPTKKESGFLIIMRSSGSFSMTSEYSFSLQHSTVVPQNAGMNLSPKTWDKRAIIGNPVQ